MRRPSPEEVKVHACYHEAEILIDDFVPNSAQAIRLRERESLNLRFFYFANTASSAILC